MATLHPIRLARESDLVSLRHIERSAGALFAQLGMTHVADDDPPAIDSLREFASDGRAWVSTDGDDRPVAYLLAELVDESAHLVQVSVHADFMRRGIGTDLLASVIEWARARELPAITLTTFIDVPWNGPYYQGHGFRYLAEDEETPGLRAIRAEEIARGLRSVAAGLHAPRSVRRGPSPPRRPDRPPPDLLPARVGPTGGRPHGTMNLGRTQQVHSPIKM